METSDRETFSASEMRYLSSLEAVRRVTPKRIYYTDAFRDEVVRRYRRGDRPVRIFRDHGLDPMLIGHKRVERATERWLRDAQPPNALVSPRPRKIGWGVTGNDSNPQSHRSATGYGLGPGVEPLTADPVNNRPQQHRTDEVTHLCGQILDRLLSLDQRIAALESSLQRSAT